MKINKFIKKLPDKQRKLDMKIGQNDNFDKLYNDFQKSSRHIDQEQKRMMQSQKDMKKHFDELTERVNKR
ncbi:MAG: hypothetical protein K5983_03950 [Lactobacillus sp.]|nr:hypothetical protein [Lactobacillus sp.]